MKNYSSVKEITQKELDKLHSVNSMMPDWKTALIVLLCIAVDMIFLFDITDSLFTQSALMSMSVALMIAFGIDGLPVVIANKIQKEKKDGLDIVILIACTITFVGLIIGIFVLRWSMMDVIYTSADSISINSSTGIMMEETEYVASSADKCMTVIMSIIPVSTSLITFAAATQKPVRQKKFELLQKRMILMESYKQDLLTQIHETERELQRDLDTLEKEKYENMLRKKNAMLELLNGQAKISIAMKIGTPEAVSELLENKEE